MNETVVTLKKGEGRIIKSGGAWIYDNEIDTIKGRFTNGALVKVVDFDGYEMGTGFINQNSKIRVRMMTRDPKIQVDDEFIYMQVKKAWEYRKTVLSNDLNCVRIIFGEADFFPGMVIDKYADVLVVESLALGIDLLKEKIVKSLVNILKEDGILIKGVYERSDAPVRKKEGLEPFKGFLYAVSDNEDSKTEEGFFNYKEFDTNVEIVENNVHYMVDVVNGQKTGFFLDQKYNRLAMQRVCEGITKNMLCKLMARENDKVELCKPENGIKILDCFTHMGTFALNCGYAIKKVIDENLYALPEEDGLHNDTEELYKMFSVTGLDISEYAVSQATENAKRNNLTDIVKFRAANVLDELPKLNDFKEKYDVVILDPPAFTKSKEATKNAIKGYREINMKGLRLVKDGGYFATCSCSHFMTQELFTTVISQAAKAVHKRLRQIEFRTQAPDHPILWAADESYYLKFFIFQVVDER